MRQFPITTYLSEESDDEIKLPIKRIKRNLHLILAKCDDKHSLHKDHKDKRHKIQKNHIGYSWFEILLTYYINCKIYRVR